MKEYVKPKIKLDKVDIDDIILVSASEQNLKLDVYEGFDEDY